ncbi:hypothetical protein KTO58_19820 [Chitinophaga pendula]|uniref:phage head morphogenesis protein n=1 Tax=Chitinophaga TaxID=79328 RepID=UPI000BAF7B7E|nr:MULTISPECIES: phage minor head protein [Chitinophaga]ASZ11084.1 hypothetical protein CK934_08980 [Chitinophaga sp. MD30]UCJ05919.1 hypothetical protein KTO58_19820 [Chitinophaga pendula]
MTVYDKGCSCSRCAQLDTGAKKAVTKFNGKTWEAAVKLVLDKGHMRPEMLKSKQVKALIKETARLLSDAVDFGISDNTPPTRMIESLKNDVFVFSGFKTYVSLKEASSLILDEQNKVKTFERFRTDVEKINSRYNKDYLESEYIFATSSAQEAANWAEYEKDGDRYNLQYRTAGDSLVRPAHAILNLITLDINDSFWDYYYTPLGWRCRCRVVQVRKGKYEVSDSNKSSQLGEQATTALDKNGNNTAEMFRFNPGKQQVIFPPNHPYRAEGKEATSVIDQISNVEK